MNKYELVEKSTGRIVQPGELIVNVHGFQCTFVRVEHIVDEY